MLIAPVLVPPMTMLPFPAVTPEPDKLPYTASPPKLWLLPPIVMLAVVAGKGLVPHGPLLPVW